VTDRPRYLLDSQSRKTSTAFTPSAGQLGRLNVTQKRSVILYHPEIVHLEQLARVQRRPPINPKHANIGQCRLVGLRHAKHLMIDVRTATFFL